MEPDKALNENDADVFSELFSDEQLLCAAPAGSESRPTPPLLAGSDNHGQCGQVWHSGVSSRLSSTPAAFKSLPCTPEYTLPQSQHTATCVILQTPDAVRIALDDSPQVASPPAAATPPIKRPRLATAAADGAPDDIMRFLLSPTIKVELCDSPGPSDSQRSPACALMRSLPAGIHAEYLNLSSAAGGSALSGIASSFQRDFVKYQDADYEFPPMEFDFAELAALERTTISETPRPAAEQRVTHTQAARPGARPAVESNAHNVSSSWPLPRRALAPLSEVSSEAASLHGDVVADATLVPGAVKQLYDVIKSKYSDFAFVYALGAQLCQDRVPMDCFVNLKMALLLSLASIGPNVHRPPIPIVTIGNDTRMCNLLLVEIGQLAARFVGPALDVRPPAAPAAGSKQQRHWLEADPVQLAKGGVFFAGDWSCLKAARADSLLHMLEYACVPVVNAPTSSNRLETAIWTHWRCSTKRARAQQAFNKLVKVFGVPIFMDEANHEALVDLTLEQVAVRTFESTVDHLSISGDDMRSFLAVVGQRTVDLTPRAQELLQRYFVAVRTDRPDCLSQQAFLTLTQLAESFAKLSFRHEVLPMDVVGAIYVCENSLQNIFGACSYAPPPFEAHNFIGLVDGQLVRFHQWLNDYIVKYEPKDDQA